MRRRSRVSNFAAGVIGALVILIICYLVFGGSLPFSGSPFVLKAQFTTETQLHIPSEVRIAGVKVGEVVSVTHKAGQTGVVTMDIDQNGLPIHADATVDDPPADLPRGQLLRRPLAGNSRAPRSSPRARRSRRRRRPGPSSSTACWRRSTPTPRANLQTLLQGIGGALNAPPTPAEDATQDPIVRGLTGGQALNVSLKLLRRRVRGLGDRQPGAPRDPAPRPGRRGQGQRAGVPGTREQRSPAPEPRDTFNATMARARLAPAVPVADDRGAPAVARGHRQRTGADPGVVRADRAARRRADPPGVEQLDPTIGVALPWLAQSTALVLARRAGRVAEATSPRPSRTPRARSRRPRRC